MGKNAMRRHSGGRNGFADFGRITPNQGRKRHSPLELFGKRHEVLPFAVAAHQNQNSASLSSESAHGGSHCADIGPLGIVNEIAAFNRAYKFHTMRLPSISAEHANRRPSFNARARNKSQSCECVHGIVPAADEELEFRQKQHVDLHLIAKSQPVAL